MTATVWSNIFNLASFRTSVNQMELNVLVADDIDVGVGERGALVLASRFGANGSVLVSSGFRAMSFRRQPLTDALR